MGQSNLLSYENYMKICEILKINPSLVQQPVGDHIHILIGLDALNLLGHPVTVVPDQFARDRIRKIRYPLSIIILELISAKWELMDLSAHMVKWMKLTQTLNITLKSKYLS